MAITETVYSFAGEVQQARDGSGKGMAKCSSGQTSIIWRECWTLIVVSLKGKELSRDNSQRGDILEDT